MTFGNDPAYTFAAMKDAQQLESLRDHIRKVMKRRKLTQLDLSRAAGVTPVDVSRILKGVNPRWTKGAKLMAIK